MKKYILIVIVSLLVVPLTVLAVSDSGRQSVEEVVAAIRQAQNASDSATIDCDRVANERWEELGEAIMAVMHPDPRQHELMDQMMGGEGSESLTAAHIAMGQRYLGCADYNFNMMSGMMGGGMMGFYPSGGSYSNYGSWDRSMMSNGSYAMMGPVGLGLSYSWGWVV